MEPRRGEAGYVGQLPELQGVGRNESVSFVKASLCNPGSELMSPHPIPSWGEGAVLGGLSGKGVG